MGEEAQLEEVDVSSLQPRADLDQVRIFSLSSPFPTIISAIDFQCPTLNKEKCNSRF